MTDNPNDPRVPAPGDDDPTQQQPATEPPGIPIGGGVDLGDLPPLDDDIEPPRRSPATRGRILAAAAVLVLVAGGAAFALTRGGDDGKGNDGVASIDGGGNKSSSNGSGNGDGDKPSQAEMQDAAFKFAKCMRDHGINMPDPKVSADGGVGIQVEGPMPGSGGNASDQDKKMQAANKACQHFMDDVAPQKTMSPDEIAKMQDQQTKMAECMRGKGYDMPDPKVSGDGKVSIGSGAPAGGPGGPKPGQKGPDAKFEKDMDACAKKAGMKGPGEGGGKFSSQGDGGGGA